MYKILSFILFTFSLNFCYGVVSDSQVKQWVRNEWQLVVDKKWEKLQKSMSNDFVYATITDQTLNKKQTLDYLKKQQINSFQLTNQFITIKSDDFIVAFYFFNGALPNDLVWDEPQLMVFEKIHGVWKWKAVAPSAVFLPIVSTKNGSQLLPKLFMQSKDLSNTMIKRRVNAIWGTVNNGKWDKVKHLMTENFRAASVLGTTGDRSAFLHNLKDAQIVRVWPVDQIISIKSKNHVIAFYLLSLETNRLPEKQTIIQMTVLQKKQGKWFWRGEVNGLVGGASILLATTKGGENSVNISSPCPYPFLNGSFMVSLYHHPCPPPQ